MKRLYTILSLTICTLSVYAQNNVFVLVDVSKSGAKTLKEKDAKNITEDIVSASFSLNTYHSWKLIDDLNTISDPNLKLIFTGSGSPFPLASNNSVVGLVEIGNYGRNLSNKVFSRLSPSQDFRTFI